jgi:sortase (surface protein transpeptidase)
MTIPASPADNKRIAGIMRSSKRWWVAAVVLLLIGAGFLTLGLTGDQDLVTGPTTAMPTVASPLSAAPTPSRSLAPSATPSAKPAAKAMATPPRRPSTGSANQAAALARSAPVALRIPAIGVSLTLSTLGLNSDGTVQVPVKDQAPGWFRLGPTPGQMGSAVILGHVDDYKGPAAFYRLRSLRAGDKVDVSLANGAVAHFAVNSVASYLKTQFPAQLVYASHGYRALQLVTCGGQFDSGTGHYLSNTVVFTSLVGTTPPA